MINRLFLIFEPTPEHACPPVSPLMQDGDPYPVGAPLPRVDNVYYSIRVDPGANESLMQAYALIANTASLVGDTAALTRNTAFGQTAPSPLGLTISIDEPLEAEAIRFITSFLFIPSYLTMEQRPVINLAGGSPDLLRETAASLSGYLSGQGIPEPVINIIVLSGAASASPEAAFADPQPPSTIPLPDITLVFHTPTALITRYRSLLQSDRCYNNNIFYYVPGPPSAADTLHSTLLSLQQAELEFKQQSPLIYSLIRTNQALEKELHTLGNRHSGTEMELRHQKQYVEVLRSDHATKELQNYYTREYEILPLWYKRFGHIIKVLTGKRTFQSLFRHDVKKYKD